MSPAVDGDEYLPSDDLLSEQSYLIARGVRPMALVGQCPADAAWVLTRVATRMEEVADPATVPFVVDHGDGNASYGFAAAAWVLDLYQWSVSDKRIPQEQR